MFFPIEVTSLRCIISVWRITLTCRGEQVALYGSLPLWEPSLNKPVFVDMNMSLKPAIKTGISTVLTGIASGFVG